MKSVTYNNLKVFYLENLHGGGLSFGQDYVLEVEKRYKKLGTICEFCSGPGFIGFSLLANNLCDKLVLIDINPKAIDVCKKTIQYNKLEDKVKLILSDALKNVPEGEQWDLVVSNPPHFDGDDEASADIISVDKSWALHKNFYSNIHKYLNQEGEVLFQENFQGSAADIFKNLIVDNENLVYLGSEFYRKFSFKYLFTNIIKLFKKATVGDRKGLVTQFYKGPKVIKLHLLITFFKYPCYFVRSKLR